MILGDNDDEVTNDSTEQVSLGTRFILGFQLNIYRNSKFSCTEKIS